MKERVRVFNHSPYTLCYKGEGLEEYKDNEVTFRSDRWVEVPRDFAVNRLDNNPHLTIDWCEPVRSFPNLLPYPYLTLSVPLDRYIGYGTVGERFAHHLIGKVPLKLSPIGYWNPMGVWSEKVKAEMRAEGKEKPTEWALCVTIPPDLPKVPSPKRILYTMWETADLPNDEAHGNWAGMINAWTEAVVVPSVSQVEVYKRAGVTVPIYVVGLGVNEEFAYYERPVRGRDEPFTGLVYGMLTSRKSPIETINMFWYGLKDKNWRLILKTRAGQLGAGGFSPVNGINDDRITVINEDYSAAQMLDLCKMADVGISMSKFEGYGLPGREMMATGLPVIWTEFSGHVDECDPKYNVPIGVVGVGDADDAYANLGGWGIPNWEMAKVALEGQYEAWVERGRGQSEMGRRASAWVKGRCNWERNSMRLLEVVQEVVRKDK